MFFLFAERQWKKYNGHCYYYGNDRRTMFLAMFLTEVWLLTEYQIFRISKKNNNKQKIGVSFFNHMRVKYIYIYELHVLYRLIFIL